jgi:arsenite methyltransferase
MKKYLSNKFDFEQSVDLYDEVPLWSAPFGLKLLEYINYRQNISALDIGFGNGFPLTELAMRLGEGSIVYGIDPWAEAVERAKRKIGFYEINNIKIIEGVAESIPLDDHSIDLIVSNNGLNNVDNLEKSLSECARILKQGGQLVMTVNLDKSMFEFYSQLEAVLLEMKMHKEIDDMHRHIYHKRKPLDLIMRLLNKNNFIIKDLEHDQFDYRFAHAGALFNHYFIRLAFMDSWIQIIPKDKLEFVFDNIESRLNEQTKIHGVIKLSIPFVVINAIRN